MELSKLILNALETDCLSSLDKRLSVVRSALSLLETEVGQEFSMKEVRVLRNELEICLK